MTRKECYNMFVELSNELRQKIKRTKDNLVGCNDESIIKILQRYDAEVRFQKASIDSLIEEMLGRWPEL